MAPRNPLEKLSKELREAIFEFVLDSDDGINLLAALRPTYNKSTLYLEALLVYYKIRVFQLNYRSLQSLPRLPLMLQNAIRQVEITFENVELSYLPKRYRNKCQITVVPNQYGNLDRRFDYAEVERFEVVSWPPISYALFPQLKELKVLRIDASKVYPDRMRMIENMVREAIQKGARLTRIEIKHITTVPEDPWTTDGDHLRQTQIDMWVGRINEGTGIKAKLTQVHRHGFLQGMPISFPSRIRQFLAGGMLHFVPDHQSVDPQSMTARLINNDALEDFFPPPSYAPTSQPQNWFWAAKKGEKLVWKDGEGAWKRDL